MGRKRYTDKFRASAVLMLEAAGYEPGANGGALTSVSNKLKVPLSTLKGWYTAEHNPVPAEVRTEKKGELVDIIRREIYQALDEAPNARPEASYRDLITGAAILVDKLQLLTGEPTDRTEVHVNDARELLISRLDSIRERRRLSGLDNGNQERLN